MARTTPQKSLTPKQQALHDLEEARASLAHHAAHAVEEWSPRAIFTRSVEKHRGVWIGAAVIAGLVVLKAIWPSKRSSQSSESSFAKARHSGWIALLLSPLIGLARKSAMNYGSQLVESYLRQKISPNDLDAGAV
jgi:sensor c-di-GMP phosphodiesterase-like protein